MALDRERVDQVLEEHKAHLRRFGVKRLSLFGSVARGEAKPTSDIDFLVEFEKKTFDAYMDTKFYLEDLFGRKVDLVLPGTLKPRLRERILGEAIHGPRF